MGYNNHINDIGAITFAEALQKKINYRYYIFHNLQKSDKGAVALAEELKINSMTENIDP